jgi:NAD(P)-dependent dehydrogenase (short-subunit alcohol dehydrogenase family)
MGSSLAGRPVFILGAVDEFARTIAVTLAEAGATISVTTANRDSSQEFIANSVLNEAWSMGRAGAAFSTDAAHLDEVRAAIELKPDGVLVAAPSVATESWPLELAQDTGRPLVYVRNNLEGFIVSVEEGTSLPATAGTLAETVARLVELRD